MQSYRLCPRNPCSTRSRRPPNLPHIFEDQRRLQHDPSRKTIDMDESLQRSFNDAVSIIADGVVSLLSQKTVRKGFFTPFVNANGLPQMQAKLRLLPALVQSLQSRTIADGDGGTSPFTDLRLKPEWLGYEDYERLCHGDIAAVPKTLVVAHPEIMSFLDQLGVPAAPSPRCH